jgi:hypothetical protein
VDVAVAAAVVGATASATVLLPALDDDKSEVLQQLRGEVVEIHPNVLNRAPVVRNGPVMVDANEPLRCMVDLDCLLHEVEVAAGLAAAVPAVPEPVDPSAAPPPGASPRNDALPPPDP